MMLSCGTKKARLMLEATKFFAASALFISIGLYAQSGSAMFGKIGPVQSTVNASIQGTEAIWGQFSGGSSVSISSGTLSAANSVVLGGKGKKLSLPLTFAPNGKPGAFSVSLTTTYACSGSCSQPNLIISISGSGIVVRPHPYYFGFYDSNSPGFPDETPAVSGFANTTWIGCGTPAGCVAALQEAEQYKMYAVVAFGRPGMIAPGYTGAALQAWERSWRTNWDMYVSALKPYVDDGTIAALYPYDEPFGAEWTASNNAADTTAALNFVATTIHGSFPSAKVAMVLTGGNTFTYFTHNQNILPDKYDWIGIDIYGCFSLCTDNNKIIKEPYAWFLRTLEANLYAGQKVILLPGTAIYYGKSLEKWHINVSATQWKPVLEGNTADVQSILNLSVADYTHVIGEFGYQYQTYNIPNGQVWIGANEPGMTTMLDTVIAFGKEMKKQH